MHQAGKQAGVHLQDADWSSQVGNSASRQTRYLLSRSVDFGEAECRRDKYVLSDRLKVGVFLQSDPPGVLIGPLSLGERCSDVGLLQ